MMSFTIKEKKDTKSYLLHKTICLIELYSFARNDLPYK